MTWEAAFDSEVLLRSIYALLPQAMFRAQRQTDGSMVFPLRPFCDWECAMVACAEAWQEYSPCHRSCRYQALGAACLQQGVILQGAHSALGDSLATAAVIRAVAASSPRGWTPEDVPWDWV